MVESGTSRTIREGLEPLTTDTRLPRNSPDLLSAFESCTRAGFWSQSWRKHRMTPIQMLHEAVNSALTEDHPDPGENAHDHYVALASERGLELSDSLNVYRTAMNHAAIADLVVTAVKSRWQILPPIGGWVPACLRGANYLRRFLAVSHWNEDRELFERQSWYCLGEVAHYRIPMQLVVANIGHMSGGRRVGYWSKALLHPQRSHLRFKRKSRGTIEGFKESWSPVYREDNDRISRDQWLQSMLEDDVLQESLFVVNIPVPEEAECRRIEELAKRQLNRVQQIRELPDRQLSTCFDPIRPCPFRVCCHGQTESGPELGGFDRIETMVPTH